MYSISVKVDFSAAHRLRNYKGKCESLHGHNWRVETIVNGTTLNALGMLIDFHDLRDELLSVITLLDHKDLNETKMFESLNPTAENIAKWIFDEMSSRLKADNVSISEIRVWESEHSCAVYTG